MKTYSELSKERDNCPNCDCVDNEIIYKGKRKSKGRYYKKLKCSDCGFEFIAESESEFNLRIKDYE